MVSFFCNATHFMSYIWIFFLEGAHVTKDVKRDPPLESHIVCVRIQSCKTLWDPTEYSLCPWDFPGKSTGVGWHSLLPDPGAEPVSLVSPALAGGFCTTSATWAAHISTLLWSYSLIKSWCCLVLPPPKGRHLKAGKQRCSHCIPSTHTLLVRGKGNQIFVESMDELYQFRVTTLIILCCSVLVSENCR